MEFQDLTAIETSGEKATKALLSRAEESVGSPEAALISLALLTTFDAPVVMALVTIGLLEMLGDRIDGADTMKRDITSIMIAGLELDEAREKAQA